MTPPPWRETCGLPPRAGDARIWMFSCVCVCVNTIVAILNAGIDALASLKTCSDAPPTVKGRFHAMWNGHEPTGSSLMI